MRVSVIVAASANNVIGVNGGLPWHLPEDLRQFKAVTMGKPMIMGRRTFASIGRPLPGRRSIVLTRQDDIAIDGCEIANSPQHALQLAGDADEVMVIGGGTVYEQMLPHTDRIYLTRVDAEIEGDTVFPYLVAAEWVTTSSEEYPVTAERPTGFSIQILDRVVTPQDSGF